MVKPPRFGRRFAYGTGRSCAARPQGGRRDPWRNGPGTTHVEHDAARTGDAAAAHGAERDPRHGDVRKTERKSEDRVQGLVGGFLDGQKNDSSLDFRRPRVLAGVQPAEIRDALRVQAFDVDADRSHPSGRRDRGGNGCALVIHAAGVPCRPLSSSGRQASRLDGRKTDARDEIGQALPGCVPPGLHQDPLASGRRNVARMRKPTCERSARDHELRRQEPELVDQRLEIRHRVPPPPQRNCRRTSPVPTNCDSSR